jgi:hypothetical protein
VAYEVRFYCHRSADVSDVEKELRKGFLSRYPGLEFHQIAPQPKFCEFEIEAPTGSYVYASVDVDRARVIANLARLSESSPGIEGVKMIATVDLSGPADERLLEACWSTFVDDFKGIPWDEADGFEVKGFSSGRRS